jgi:hypothetical protein
MVNRHKSSLEPGSGQAAKPGGLPARPRWRSQPIRRAASATTATIPTTKALATTEPCITTPGYATER